MMRSMDKKRLLKAAENVAKNAYSPYFHFKVGAAVYADGEIFCGVNVENAISGLGMCAERVAIAHALSHGAKRIEAIAISCIDAKKHENDDVFLTDCLPCGGCLQWISELARDAVIMTTYRQYSLTELMPIPFRLRERQD